MTACVFIKANQRVNQALGLACVNYTIYSNLCLKGQLEPALLHHYMFPTWSTNQIIFLAWFSSRKFSTQTSGHCHIGCLVFGASLFDTLETRSFLERPAEQREGYWLKVKLLNRLVFEAIYVSVSRASLCMFLASASSVGHVLRTDEGLTLETWANNIIFAVPRKRRPSYRPLILS